MKDFFIAFSSTIAAVAGIIFAFLISKSLGFEEYQDNILDSAEKKELEIKKIEEQIKNIKVLNGIKDNRISDIRYSFAENLKNDYYFFKENKSKYIEDYCLKKEIYYLDWKEVENELNEEISKFLAVKINIMKKYIDKLENEEFCNLNSVDDLKNKLEFKFLYEVYDEVNKYFMEEKAMKMSIFSKISSFNILKSMENITIPYEELRSFNNFLKETINLEKEIKNLLIDYIYKKEEINQLLKKINNLNNERKNIITFLGISYGMIIFGVIYPLSYIKFTNNDVLDYTLYNNFFSEIFSQSGIMLLILALIFSIFSYKIYSAIKVKSDLKKFIEQIKKLDILESQNKILRTFNYFENLKKNE